MTYCVPECKQHVSKYTGEIRLNIARAYSVSFLALDTLFLHYGPLFIVSAIRAKAWLFTISV